MSASSASSSWHLLGRFWYLILAALLLLGVFFWWWRFRAFTDLGYMPLQPIPYSHRLHAGTYQIPCQYCHFNAQRGKHAGAPPLSVCLGCHAPDQGAVASTKPNIQTLLKLTENPVAGYVDTDDLDDRAAGIHKEGGVVHWNRVHLLPDHVYFSHEWHVKAGVACQTCHGPVQNMEVVWQQSDLTMGWCLDCHRKTDHTTLATGRSGLHERWDGSAEGFRVGTANYDVLRSRIRPDDMVTFNERHVAGAHQGEDAAEAHANETPDVHAAHAHETPAVSALRGVDNPDLDQSTGKDVGFWTAAQAAQLQKLLAQHPDLPRWRVADLPESHRAFYGEVRLQNAPTQCSTCHQ